MYFYRQVNGEPPADLVSSQDITDVHARNNQIRRNVILGLVNEAAVAVATATTITPQRSRRTTAPSSGAEPMPEGGDETMVGGTTNIDARRGGCGSVPIYWDSPEASKLFGFCYENGDNVFQGIEKQIDLLAEVMKSHDGYKKLLETLIKCLYHLHRFFPLETNVSICTLRIV